MVETTLLTLCHPLLSIQGETAKLHMFRRQPLVSTQLGITAAPAVLGAMCCRVWWKTQAVTIGVQIPPEGWQPPVSGLSCLLWQCVPDHE